MLGDCRLQIFSWAISMSSKAIANWQPWWNGKRRNPGPGYASMTLSAITVVGPILHLNDYSTGMGNIELRGDGQIDLTTGSNFDIRAISRLNGERTSEQGCGRKQPRPRQDVPFVSG